MCGIFAMLFEDEKFCIEFYKNYVEELLIKRGPNWNNCIFANNVFFGSSVLFHQGSLVAQPISDENIILLFNGDLFMDIKGSDTLYLMSLLQKAQTDEDLLDIFRKVTGPFSIIFYFNKALYFIRDSLGRNSLIIGRNGNSIFLTSVIDQQVELALEIPSLGLYKMNLETKNIELYPFQEITHEIHLEQLDRFNKIVNVAIKEETINPKWLLHRESAIEFSFNQLNFDEINQKDLFEELLTNPIIDGICDKLINLLTKSVQDRVLKTRNECKGCLENNVNCLHCNVALLYSGGVDCSILAVLLHKFLNPEKPIDLLNVAFEKAGSKNPINFNVPDRLTGLQTLEELKDLLPERSWNFVEINVSRQELYNNRTKLSSLVHPLSSILDESLGSAIYFASRGTGILDEKPYQSQCRVILMGSGADELFGGYTRHRNAFRRSTPQCNLLEKELELDWIRLPFRNLARDDRVVAENGCTVRAPYLEEEFVSFIRSLKPLQRCMPNLPEGIGDKLLLRLCAHKIGLWKCSKFRKRALQFGSRIADKKESAADKSKFLKNKENTL